MRGGYIYGREFLAQRKESILRCFFIVFYFYVNREKILREKFEYEKKC